MVTIQGLRKTMGAVQLTCQIPTPPSDTHAP